LFDGQRRKSLANRDGSSRNPGLSLALYSCGTGRARLRIESVINGEAPDSANVTMKQPLLLLVLYVLHDDNIENIVAPTSIDAAFPKPRALHG
jgi:hypothetical protein